MCAGWPAKRAVHAVQCRVLRRPRRSLLVAPDSTDSSVRPSGKVRSAETLISPKVWQLQRSFGAMGGQDKVTADGAKSEKTSISIGHKRAMRS